MSFGWLHRRVDRSVRYRFLFVAVLLVPVGVATKLYTGPADAWVRAHAGGFIYVLFWCLLVLAIWPRLSSWVVGGAVFTVTSALEFLQLWHPAPLEAVRATFVGHLLIGSSFSWPDFLYYGAGSVAAVAVAGICRRSGRDSPGASLPHLRSR